MNQYTYVKPVNSARLFQEIEASVLPNPSRIDTVGANVLIFFDNPLSSEEETTLGNLITAHVLVDTDEMLLKRIENAKVFGKSLIDEFALRNIKAGKTVAQIKNIMVALQFTQMALMSGSMYVALSYIQALTPSADISQDDINYFTQRIQTYLGL